MPYFSIESATYERLSERMNFISSGVTWLIDGHRSKLSLAYENRPVYFTNGTLHKRLGSEVMQYQIFF